MVRERGTGAREMNEREVSGVMGNVDRGGKEGVVADGNGDEKPVQPEKGERGSLVML